MATKLALARVHVQLQALHAAPAPRLDERAVPLGQLEQAVEHRLVVGPPAAVLVHQTGRGRRARPARRSPSRAAVAALDLADRARRAASRRTGWRNRASAGRRSRGQEPLHRLACAALAGGGAHPRVGGCVRRSASVPGRGTARAARGRRPSTSCRCRAGSRREGTCACRDRGPSRAGRDPARRRGTRGASTRSSGGLRLGATIRQQVAPHVGVGDLDQA